MQPVNQGVPTSAPRPFGGQLVLRRAVPSRVRSSAASLAPAHQKPVAPLLDVTTENASRRCQAVLGSKISPGQEPQLYPILQRKLAWSRTHRIILAVVFTRFFPVTKIKKVWYIKVKIDCVRQNEVNHLGIYCSKNL